MRILLIGSGGREHALAWKIRQSPLVKDLYCAPGNAGIAELAQCAEIKAEDIHGLLKFAKGKKIDLTVVGPEVPLVAGIVDLFEKEGLKIFGPSQAAAQLEGSKVFTKEFLHRRNIPTAGYKIFDKSQDALSFVEQADYPLVIKAEGLAAGKGVMICHSRQEAKDAVKQIMEDKVFQGAGNRIVAEEFLDGEEASVLAICDGERYVILAAAQDHKRIFDDDRGPNTGGMGAYSPAPAVTSDMMKLIDARVIEPTVRGMAKDGHPFKGVLYAGLMLTSSGPKVLEFNTRFGDPETQAILPRLKTDLVEVMLAACEGRLHEMALEWDPRACVCVVMCSGGYPGKYETGKKISGLQDAAAQPDAMVFHAGTMKSGEDVVTAGGRVLGVTALGNGIEDAIKNSYAAVEKIRFDHCFFRRDIGARALKKVHA
ncbi:MAG: phosphoribosylamine--glycine ligase [Candidatus Omnitrophota bacterium]|nr:phosphoribosylamine--glycine ligase [Candidatus Omnitrophota bacterium]